MSAYTLFVFSMSDAVLVHSNNVVRDVVPVCHIVCLSQLFAILQLLMSFKVC